MAGKNDIIAQAGVSLEDFEKGMDKINSRMDGLEAKAESTGKKVDGAFKRMGNSIKQAFGAAAIGQGIGDMIASFTQVNRKAGEVDEGFIAMGESAQTGTEKAKVAFAKFAAGAASLLSFGATKPLTDAPLKQAIDEQRIRKELTTQAQTYDEIIAKVRRLQDLKLTEAAKGERNLAIQKQISELTAKAEAITAKQAELVSDTTVGAEQRLAMQRVEIQNEQKKAELANKLRDLGGNRTAEDNKAFAAGAALADAEAERQKKDIQFSAQKEESEARYLDVAKDSNISAESQINKLLTQNAEIQVQITKAKELYGVNSLAVKQLENQAHELDIQSQELEHNLDMTKTAARVATETLNAELSGNRQLSALLKNRVEYEQKIKQAMHEKRDDIAKELRTQQALNELAIRAAEIRKTPQQRAADRKEQQANDQAQRLANARDKAQKAAEARDAAADEKNRRFGFKPRENPSFRRAGEFVSPAAELARKDFVARQPLNPAPAAPAAKNAELKTDSIRTNSFIIN
jgi:hypothetical protein